MANPFTDLLFGNGFSSEELTDTVQPRRTFGDVILPASTREQLRRALTQIDKHDLVFGTWGLGERHREGLGLAFNFAGPPGTGKTICAEAIAHELGRPLLVVRHADMQSMWVGKTGKNVASVFKTAAEQDAVLFFDEADAIAGSRFASVDHGYQREANAIVSVLLKELEAHPGVVIFATNMAANLDPAFERRIRTHILFEMPEAPERRKIWRVQLHAHKTPLAGDVDFSALAERYPASGGDIKNAVLKAAQMAAAEPGLDASKKIHQRHFEQGIEEVMRSKDVMQQSLAGSGDGAASLLGDALGPQVAQRTARLDDVADRQQVAERAVELLEEQVKSLEETQQTTTAALDDFRTARTERAHLDQVWRYALLAAALLALFLAVTALVLGGGS